MADGSAAQLESLAMVIQIVRQLEGYVRAKDLSSIHNEDVILGFALEELFSRADLVEQDQIQQYRADLTSFVQRVGALHLVADSNQQVEAESELHRVMKSFNKLKTYFSEPLLAAASKAAATFTCPMHADVVGQETDLCPNAA